MAMNLTDVHKNILEIEKVTPTKIMTKEVASQNKRQKIRTDAAKYDGTNLGEIFHIKPLFTEQSYDWSLHSKRAVQYHFTQPVISTEKELYD